MSAHSNSPIPGSDPVVEGMQRLAVWLFGPDKHTRARTAAVLLCALMYVVSWAAASHAAEQGTMLREAPKLLAWICFPVYAAFYAAVRSGWSARLRDPTLMLPQNVFALLAISYAYTAVGPLDRGLVLVLVGLVMVFGMYTHQARQSVIVGVLAILMLGLSMGVLSLEDPIYYPPDLELLRFELMMSTIPSMVFCAYQLTSWRNRLHAQRTQLRETLAKVEELATRDPLTGLYNRRFMQDRLEDCVRRFDRYGEAFTLALLDLDHFKQINDQLGHRTGDQALRAFADAARSVLRDADTVARWGGEEFVVLMPNTSTARAQVALKRLRHALDQLVISSSHPDLRVRFSTGLATHDRAAPLVRTLERADQALYQAKQTGRNRDVLADPATAD